MKLKTADLKNVSMKDAFWDRYTRLIPGEVLPYQWQVLNDELDNVEQSHALQNFRIAAGKEKGDFYGFVFQDSDVAKWLEAVAYANAREPDPALLKKADRVIDLIGEAQRPDGYLDTYFQIRCPDRVFTNLREGHELYCAGHMIEAGCAYYQATGKKKLLEICCRLADFIVEQFHTERLQRGVPGHEEIELALVRLYEVTKEERYLEMAAEFLDRRGQEPNYLLEEEKDPAWKPVFPQAPEGYHPDYAQADEPVRQQKTARGHAVRAVYLYCAMADIAYYKDDEGMMRACRTLYDNIVEKQMYITGSIGSSGYLERFTTDYDLPNDMNYSETCASVGLALFARRMAQITGDASYMDTAECALYNTVLSGISQDGKSFFYVNPLTVWPASCMEAASRSHIKPVRQKWFACACCPPNIARTLASLGEYCYFTDSTGFFVNLFVSGEAVLPLGGRNCRVRTETDFPFGGSWRIVLEDGDYETEGSIRIRVPEYAENFRIMKNGEEVPLSVRKHYAWIEGWFRGGDEIRVSFEIPPVFMRANPEVRADAGRVALKKGPLVYCLEEQDNGRNLEQYIVDPDEAVEEIYRPDLLGGTLVLRGRGCRTVVNPAEKGLYRKTPFLYEKAVLDFVPYAYWGNRVPGEMLVWVREK